MAKFNGMEIPSDEGLKHQSLYWALLGRTKRHLMSKLAVANFVNLLKLLVEHLMHLKWGALIGMHTQDSLSQAKSVLKIALAQFLICLH